MATAKRVQQCVLFVLIGTALLVLKPHYRGPLAPLVHDFGGNVAASFAVYFMAAQASFRLGKGRWLAVISALLAVELFEIADGFGFMTNVFDPFDLLANVVGIGLALAVDLLAWPGRKRGGSGDENLRDRGTG
jgi:hypothetical protein